jgi:glycosyl transferase family 1
MESSNGHGGRTEEHQWTGNTPRRPLRIAMIMPPWYEVPPAGYGGLERVCASLIDGLIARGHHVTLFGTGTQTGTRARFVSTNPELQYPRLLESMPELVAISHSQRRMAADLRWTATVHHGIEVDAPAKTEPSDGPVLWLGRFDPEKGPDLAIEACRKADLPLVLAGKANQQSEWRYLDEVIRPMLGSDVELVLNAGRDQTDELLLTARSLLMSIRWEEPFGMVMIEAMAKGTPVVAMRRGSVPEVVLHGRTGVVCLDESELPDALHAADVLDPADCVAHVRTTFSVDLMAHRYERVYRKLIDRRERRTAPLDLSTRGLL